MRVPFLAIGVAFVVTLAPANGASQAVNQTSAARDTSLDRVSAVAETENFCCPDYLRAVVAQIQRNWTPPTVGLSPAAAGVRFAIASDGRVSEVSLEKRSGNGLLDMGALNAMAASRLLPPLPRDFRHLTLPVRVLFEHGSQPTSDRAGPEIICDTRGVDFGPWIQQFMAAIKRHWLVPASALSASGEVSITFYVSKAGFISDVTLTKSSFFDVFNNAASNAIFASNPAQPLPTNYPADRAFFTINFFYHELKPQAR